MINKNVIDDLDAIYFFDKVNMRANSANHTNIPKLDLNFINVKQQQQSQQKIKKEDTQNIAMNYLIKMPVYIKH